MIPLVSVVLPDPRSPDSSTSMGAVKFCASLRPISTVSSGECDTISLAGTISLRDQPCICRWDGIDQFGCQQRRLAHLSGCQIARNTMQIDTESQHTLP